MSAPRAGFLAQLAVLWRLRFALALNEGRRRSGLVAVAGWFVSSAGAWVLGPLFFALAQWEPVASSRLWTAFLLQLLGFVTSAVWVTWPVLSAGVDDHSEVSRYAAFPISPFRLLAASTLAGLFEPRAFVIYAPFAGACAGFLAAHGTTSPLLVALLFAAYVLMNAAWGRVGLHLVLRVLQAKESAGTIGLGLVVTIALCALIPPVDTSWLADVGNAGLGALQPDVVRQAALAMGRVPSGWAGRGVRVLAEEGREGEAIACLVGLGVFLAIGAWVAWRLLLNLQAPVRGVVVADPARRTNPFVATRGVFETLVVREALDLWRNPRARLLAAVPFVLAILLRLLNARSLAVFLAGDSADAWLVTILCLYGAVVMVSTFSQNAFAYDGTGLALVLSSPVDLASVLRAKNLVHAGAAFVLAGAAALFATTYLGAGGPLEAAFALAGVAASVPVILATGNVLSVVFPVKFHANLKRRDRLPIVASSIGVAAAGVGAWPALVLLRASNGSGITFTDVATLVAAAGATWAIWWLAFPRSAALLVARRERVLLAVTRD